MFFIQSLNGFIAPDGQLHELNQLGHEEFALSIVNKYHMEDDDFDTACDILQACGWIQLTMSCIVFDVHKEGLRISRGQRRALDIFYSEMSPYQQGQADELSNS